MAATESGRKAARALDELYRSHAAEVYRYAYAMLGNRADAEDVTQTTFVNALRALERGESPRKPSHWLIAIAHNLVRQRFRQQQERPAMIELGQADAVMERAEAAGPSMDELVRGLQRIPRSQREALVMREFEGRSYKEIAEILGLSSGAVETLLFRARRSLAEELEHLVTCDRAELAMSKRMDGRLGRKERRRLDAHLRECPSCARLVASQSRYRRALKGLALLPLPFSLTFFRGAPNASAAGLPTIGAGGAGVAGGVSLGSAGSAAGGLAAGGVAAKVAVVIASVALAGGAGYEGAKRVHQHTDPRRTAKTGRSATTRADRPFIVQGTKKHGATSPQGQALGNGASRSSLAAEHRGRPTTPGKTNAAAGKAQHAARVPTPDASHTQTAKSSRNRAAAKAHTPAVKAHTPAIKAHTPAAKASTGAGKTDSTAAPTTAAEKPKTSGNANGSGRSQS